MNKRALIFSSADQIENGVENDCACDTHVQKSNFYPVLFPILGNEAIVESPKWQIAPIQYQEKLDEEYTLIFSAYTQPSLLVLNKQALQIMNVFFEPISIQSAMKVLNHLDIEDTSSAMQKMISLGILVRPDQNMKSLNFAQTPETLTAWLHITNECNLRCDYCYLRKTSEYMTEEQGQKSIDAVFRSASAHAFRKVKLKYAGGESTLQFKLVLKLHDYAVSIAKQLGLELTGVVLSNGIGLTNTMIEALQERNIRLSISLDGIGETHDAQRRFANGRGSFALVERSLNRLASKGFKPSITVTVSERNVKGLPQTIEYLLERKLPFTINFYRENPYSASFEDLVYHDNEMIAAMKQAFLKIEHNPPEFSILGAIIDRASLDSPHTQPCGVGSSYMVVDQRGNIAKCHMEIERKITDITAPDPFKMLQLDVIGIQNVHVDQKEGCRECQWRYWCAGGCPALTHRVTGRYDVKSPNCRIYKALFPDVLRLEGLRLLSRKGAFDNEPNKGFI